MAYDPNTDPFIGSNAKSGVRLPTGEWVPADHPLAAQAGPQAGAVVTDASGAPVTPQTPEQAAASAQTYSSTPGAAPTANTSNQGTQDVYRNTLLQRATQQIGVDRQDPAFRSVADTYAAASERSRRNATDMEAERLGETGNQNGDAMDTARRMETERSAQDVAGFESTLALRELENQRSEISQALSALGDTISGDQQRALSAKLGELNAAIERERISATSALGYADIGARERMGAADISSRESIARLANELQRYGIDADTASKMASLAVQRYGISSDASTRMAGYDTQRYGIDQSLAGQMAGYDTQRYGIDQSLTGQMAGYDTQRYGIDASSALGRGDLALRGELGRGGLSLQGLALSLQNQQFNNQLGATIGFNEAQLNNTAMRTLLGL